GVEDLVFGRQSRQRQRLGRDVGRSRRRGVDGVVARVGAADGDPADRSRLARAHVLVAERGARVPVGEDVSRNTVVGEGGGGGDGRVVALVGARGGDEEGPRRHVGRGRGNGVLQGVVARVGAADGDARDVDRLGRAHVLVAEAGGGVGFGERVARDAVVA